MIKKFINKLRRIRSFWIGSIYTLNGWRFTDIKRHIDVSTSFFGESQMAFMCVNTEFDKCADNSNRSEPARVALVSCLPPDASGIARYTMQHLINSHISVDAFSRVRDPSLFMWNSTVLKTRSKKNIRLLPISTLLSFNEINEYDKIVFVIGNSDHNIEVFQSMETFIKMVGSKKVWCYLHDPCCHNVVQMGKGLSHAQYSEFLSNLYRDRASGMPQSALEGWRIHHHAIENGMMGCRAISDMGITQFIVNSPAGEALVRKDITPSGKNSEIKIRSLYHPVFPLEKNIAVSVKDRDSEILVLGTYGMPGTSKMTDVVIDAAEALVRRGTKLKLIIAGYETDRYLNSYFGKSHPQWIEAFSPATEQELQELMAACDIALQFRRKNLGESSGIVPTLLSMGKTVVTSKIGAFEDYEKSVFYFDGGNSDALAEFILQIDRVNSIEINSYVERRNINQFSRDFYKAIYS